MNNRTPVGSFEHHVMRDGARIQCYRVPAVGHRRGGLVLIQEIFGLTEHIRVQCERFAAAGYEVLAPAIFDREAPGLDLGYGEADVAKAVRMVRAHSVDLAVDDALACADILRSSGPVFMTGYCYGGSVTWIAACSETPPTAAACYYGSMIPSRAHQVPQCPVITHFGERDKEIPTEDVKLFADKRPEVDVRLYRAGHGFNSDRRDDFDATSAARAFIDTLQHFNHHSDAPV